MCARPPIPAADLEELRERLDQAGAESLTTIECLALVLRPGGGRAALGWAERLLTRFGSLPELLGAPVIDLRREAPPGSCGTLSPCATCTGGLWVRRYGREPCWTAWSW